MTAYWPGPWPGEDGGPDRRQVPRGASPLTRGRGTALDVAWRNLAMARRILQKLERAAEVPTGDPAYDGMRDLLIATATSATANGTYDLAQLVAAARQSGLLSSLVGDATSDYALDATSSKRFGRQMEHWRDRELHDGNGRPFTFTRRKNKRGAVYPLTFLMPPPQ